jgi:hypothetical protein
MEAAGARAQTRIYALEPAGINAVTSIMHVLSLQKGRSHAPVTVGASEVPDCSAAWLALQCIARAAQHAYMVLPVALKMRRAVCMLRERSGATAARLL